MNELEHNKNVSLLLEKMEWADAILVGAASGMSAAAGHRFYYERDDDFIRLFGEFEKKYGFHNGFDGYYHPYPTRAEFWAFTATFIQHIYESSGGEPYANLQLLLSGKNYHILTTNQDTLFEQICPPEKISAIQGDWRYFQCLHRCHDAIYDNREQVRQMVDAIADCRVPEDLIPRCPKCGREMEPWVRGLSFLEGTKYREEYRKVNTFLTENRDRKILFLELGVGRMTPMFIQQPFWDLTYQLLQSFYITINPKDALLPIELVEKGAKIKEDIAVVLRDAVQQHRKELGM